MVGKGLKPVYDAIETAEKQVDEILRGGIPDDLARQYLDKVSSSLFYALDMLKRYVPEKDEVRPSTLGGGKMG